ncbi:M48 family metallopeptidase [Aerococcus viridans]|uniref:M48 family metallopeptidase n=1 Tax=Aerococcus viridans TaxID=1377 RepID=UPI002DB72C79|nr:SprT family zinc-dependent metalloprotease [Aerococcus viridans]MEC1387334.1 SprT family zinc-dependent metalloprotease [Aerococcus viridans]
MPKQSRKEVLAIKLDMTIAGFPVQVTKQANYKNLTLKAVPPHGDLRISAPKYASKAAIVAFVENNLVQIERMQADILNRYQDQVKHYETGENHYLWGQSYPLLVIEKPGPTSCQLVDDQLVLTVKPGMDQDERAQVMIAFYRQELKEQLAITGSKMMAHMDVWANEFRVKQMKTRWGTCNIQKKRIWISLSLVAAPLICLESVVVHELVHLLETNHTKRFYQLMDQYFPKWQEANAILSELPSVFH